MTPRAVILWLFLVARLLMAGRADASQRVVFADKTFLQVEDAWADDRYVHFVYHSRTITVLRSDVIRIEGARQEGASPVAPSCPPPHVGGDDQAVRAYFRCLGVRWERAPAVENGQSVWIYQGRVASRLERYVVRDGRLLDVMTSAAPDGPR
jgi:hypothetical protein